MLALMLSAALVAQPPLRPDPTLTPGAEQSTKNAVFAEYHISSRAGGPYEIDHLISLELGGSNDITNLWPESYATAPLNAHVKDALEDHLHALVCAGKVPLAQAQRDIAGDWAAAYARYVGALPK